MIFKIQRVTLPFKLLATDAAEGSSSVPFCFGTPRSKEEDFSIQIVQRHSLIYAAADEGGHHHHDKLTCKQLVYCMTSVKRNA